MNNLKVGCVSSKGRHKKKTSFFGVSPKGGGGGLAESKISLAEKTKIFLDFFLAKGGERGGGGVRLFGQCPKENVFFLQWISSLT